MSSFARSSSSRIEGAADWRLTQSWHSGTNRREVVPPAWPGWRSFVVQDNQDDLNATRTFGGIERALRDAPPTPAEKQELSTFSLEYQNIHHRRPHVIAFVNSKSGGQSGGILMKALSECIGTQEQADVAFTGEVCDLSHPDEPTNTVERLAMDLNKRVAQRRLLICGGDGTVTWILTALESCKALENKLHLLPVAIVPLGTGNDLARSLGWGPSLRKVSDVLKYLRWVVQATPVDLDQWRLVLRPHQPLPFEHKLRQPGSHPQLVSDQQLKWQLLGDMVDAIGDQDAGPGEEDVYLGLWQNYFSIGMDAKVAGYVEASRSHTTCGRICFRRGCGKLCYAWQGVRHSFCSRLLTRSLSTVRIAMDEAAEQGSVLPQSASSEFKHLEPPLSQRRVQGGRGRLRQLMFVNINSYAAGLNVQPPPRNALARPSPDDGMFEVLGVRNAMSALSIFARATRPTYLTTARKVAFRLNRGECMQLDGEPWHLDVGCDVLIEHHTRLTMLLAPPEAPFWGGHIRRGFWHAPERPTTIPESPRVPSGIPQRSSDGEAESPYHRLQTPPGGSKDSQEAQGGRMSRR